MGESESRPAYSVVFDQTGLENAARLRSLATSELRLDPNTEPQALPDLAFTSAILSALPPPGDEAESVAGSGADVVIAAVAGADGGAACGVGLADRRLLDAAELP